MIHALLAFAALPAADVNRLAISLDGTRVGHGSFTRSIDKNGRLQHKIHSEMQTADFKRVMDYESTSDRNGRPIRETEVDIINGQKVTLIMATGAKNLTVSMASGTQSRKYSVPLPKGKIEDPTIFWFYTVKPKTGTSVTYQSYDVLESKWTSRTETYVGDETVPETQVVGHHIRMSDGDRWVDAKGHEIRSERKTGDGSTMVSVREAPKEGAAGSGNGR